MELLEQISGLIISKIKIIESLFSIFKLEARLAKLSIVPVLVNILLLFVVIITTWFIAMALIALLALPTLHNPLYVALGILLINLLCFYGLTRWLKSNLQKMSFEKTREYFSEQEINEHDQLEKANCCANSSHGKKITDK